MPDGHVTHVSRVIMHTICTHFTGTKYYKLQIIELDSLLETAHKPHSKPFGSNHSNYSVTTLWQTVAPGTPKLVSVKIK